MLTHSVWQSSSETNHRITHSQVNLPQEVDVAIVGSGYTGLHAALCLRRAGYSVSILEREQAGSGASSRNAGMLLPGVKAPIQEIKKNYGIEFARELWQWTLDSIDYVRTFVKQGSKFHLPAEFQICLA